MVKHTREMHCCSSDKNQFKSLLLFMTCFCFSIEHNFNKSSPTLLHGIFVVYKDIFLSLFD